MKEDRIAMSKKERERKAILSQVVNGKLKLSTAAKQLRVSYRQAKRIYRRYRQQGDEGLVHGNYGKCSHRAYPAVFREAVLTLYRDRYEGFGPTLACEKLSQEGYTLAEETLRGWLLHEGLWDRQRKRKGYRCQRPRRACFGELLQLDGSHHHWFGPTEPEACLMNLVDDATSCSLPLLAEEETTEAAMRVLKSWIARYGIPGAIYVDLKSVYVSPKRAEGCEESVVPCEAFTHFSRACEKLGIRIIKAYSPQAKGRVERSHAVYQDRLVKELKLQGITTLADANALLSNGFVEALNGKFAKAPASEVDAHREVSPYGDLEQIFCWEYTRVVQQDWTIRFASRCYQIEETKPLRVRPKQRVIVREHLNGAVSFWYKDQQLPTRQIERRSLAPVAVVPKGYDAFACSKNAREGKGKTPWSTFNPGWLSQASPSRSTALKTRI